MKGLFDARDPLLPLRLATAVAGAIAILALYSVSGVTDARNPGVLVAMLIGFVGQYVSHRLRGRSLWFIKAILAVGMIVLLWRHMANLIANLQDTRYPLAELLLYLAVMNSFDLPRRHNLRIAMMVSVILLVVTATLSRDMSFGLFLLAFLAAGLWWAHQDMLSELGARPEEKQAAAPAIRSLLPIGTFVLVGGLVLLLAVPRNEGGGLKQLPFSTMIALPSHVDPQVRNPFYPSGGSRSGEAAPQVNPEAYYGFSEELDLNFRGRLSETIALKVRSPRRQYWRGMAYDTFDGRNWSMSKPLEVTPLNSNPFTLPARRESGGFREITTFYVEKDQTNLILMPAEPAQLYFPTGEILMDAYDSYRSPILLEKGMYYTVVSRKPPAWRTGPDRELPPEERLRRSGLDVAPYLALPERFTERTRALAHTLSAGAAGPRERLRRIEAYLKRTYPYDLSIPAFPANADQLDYFLFEEKRGYCEHFATALALMGRAVGVPTRLVTGYLPGDFNPFTGFYEVKTAHAHAWVEAYLWGYGWVPFDPTPGYAGPGEIEEGPTRPLADWARAAQGWLPVAGGVASVLGLAGGVAWLIRLPRRVRPLSEASRAYLRMVALLGKAGGFSPEGLTPREVAARVRAHGELAGVAAEVEAIIRRYEEIRFGGMPDDGSLGRAVAALESRLRKG